MGKYGEAAVLATQLYQAGSVHSPKEAWENAVKKMFPNSASSQKKSCPRGAYLGLCQDGLVRRIPPGQYARSVKNKHYAVEAVSLLATKPYVAWDEDALWAEVMKGETKVHNSQMDVVLGLWKGQMLNRP